VCLLLERDWCGVQLLLLLSTGRELLMNCVATATAAVIAIVTATAVLLLAAMSGTQRDWYSTAEPAHMISAGVCVLLVWCYSAA
jgi:hypothetical protein